MHARRKMYITFSQCGVQAVSDIYNIWPSKVSVASVENVKVLCPFWLIEFVTYDDMLLNVVLAI